LDNGTVADWALPGTSRRDLDQCPPDPLQVANLLILIGNLGLRLPANIRAATIPLDLYVQQFFDLFERESQRLSVFDEPQAFHGVFGEDAIARGRPGRPWKQAMTLVIANRLHVDARSEEHTSELQSRFDLVCR